MDINESIAKTKKCFEKSFSEKKLYERQTKDEKHLEFILGMINVKDGNKILDLGTGSGFLAFPIAHKNKNVQVIGLDIVEETLKRNRIRAQAEKLDNLKFIDYDGRKFPIEDSSVDTIVTRYALHHFPCIEETFFEISRVLKDGGILFISDPTPNENDEEGFVDEFMRLKPDGHIKFYSLQEFIDIGKNAGLKFISNNRTKIRFPRENTENCKELLSRKSEKILKQYEIESVNGEIFITENVVNILFMKNK